MIRAVKLHVLSQGKLIELERPLQGIASLEIKAPVAERKSTPDGEDVEERTKKRPRRLATFAGEETRELQTRVLKQD